MNIHETIFYLESKYLAHNEKPRIFINDILSEEPFFWSNDRLLENFFKIYQGGWKYELEKQVFNGIKSIQTGCIACS